MSGMQKGIRRSHYSEEQDFIIRRLFHADISDEEIAHELRITGKLCKAEAIRKRRRKLGLRKQPSYRRWTWTANQPSI